MPTSETRKAGLAGSIEDALAARRWFILLPFGLVGGVAVSAQLTSEPQPALLTTGAILLLVALWLSRRGLGALRLTILLGAVWTGFCLLPVHGALFGTPMLTRPAFGPYEMRVDEILLSLIHI